MFSSQKEVDFSALEKLRLLELSDLIVFVHLYMQESVRGRP